MASGNVYYRDIAQRILTERLMASKAGDSALPGLLEKLIFDDKSAKKTRLHALWALVGGDGLNDIVRASIERHRGLLA